MTSMRRCFQSITCDRTNFDATCTNIVNLNICYGRGLAQYAPFDLILWYIAKTIPTLLEYDQFVMQISHAFFDLFFTFVRSTKDRSNYYNTIFQQASVFKCCYRDIEICFVPYFGAEYGKMLILKLYIYFPASTHSDEQQHHSTTLPSYHLYIANIVRQGIITSIWFKTY